MSSSPKRYWQCRIFVVLGATTAVYHMGVDNLFSMIASLLGKLWCTGPRPSRPGGTRSDSSPSALLRCDVRFACLVCRPASHRAAACLPRSRGAAGHWPQPRGTPAAHVHRDLRLAARRLALPEKRCREGTRGAGGTRRRAQRRYWPLSLKAQGGWGPSAGDRQGGADGRRLPQQRAVLPRRHAARA